MTKLRGLVVHIDLGGISLNAPCKFVVRDDISGSDVACNMPAEFVVEMDEMPLNRPVEIKMINGVVQSLQLLEEGGE